MTGKRRERDVAWEIAEKRMLGSAEKGMPGNCRERNAGKVLKKGCWESAEKVMLGK
jgi:hypothetical protein